MAAEEMTSDEVRKELTRLLPRIQLQGLVVHVRRYNDEMAVLVPPDWFERAVAAIGMPPAPAAKDTST